MSTEQPAQQQPQQPPQQPAAVPAPIAAPPNPSSVPIPAVPLGYEYPNLDPAQLLKLLRSLPGLTVSRLSLPC
jgi:hypothetical protein